jgi:hypothetical protein
VTVQIPLTLEPCLDVSWGSSALTVTQARRSRSSSSGSGAAWLRSGGWRLSRAERAERKRTGRRETRDACGRRPGLRQGGSSQDTPTRRMVYKATPSVSKSVHGVNWPLTVRELEIVACGVRPGRQAPGSSAAEGAVVLPGRAPATPIVGQDRHYERSVGRSRPMSSAPLASSRARRSIGSATFARALGRRVSHDSRCAPDVLGSVAEAYVPIANVAGVFRVPAARSAPIVGQHR